MKKNNYTIYFEIFGKKMKTTLSAESEAKAMEVIRNKIIFHKIEKQNENDIVNNLRNIFGMK